MVSCSDTPRRPDQTTGSTPLPALAGLLWAISLLTLPTPAQGQVLCPAGGYSDDALALEGVAAVQVRRAGQPVLWAHEGACGRAELGKHWGSLRVSHAFGQAATPGQPQRDQVEQSARLLSEYRFQLKPVADTGTLRLSGLLHYEHDPLGGTDQRLQLALGPRLDAIDDYRVRLGFGLAYYLEMNRPEVAPDAPAASFARRSGGWLSAALGFSVREGVLWSEELLLQLPVEGEGGFEPRAYLQSTFRVHGSEHLAIEAALLVTYDGFAPNGFERWDTVLRAGVVLTL